MKITKLFILFLMVIFTGCGDGSSGGGREARSFYLGFSPWMYEASMEAMDWTYSKINEHGDIISHHLEEGVPWQESYDGSEFSTSYRNEIQNRVSRHISGKKVLLQISPLNIERNGMALNRGDGINEPLNTPWSGYALNSDQVKTAYLNYARRMTEYFSPDFLIIGVEVNLLKRNNPSLWPAYTELHAYVYNQLKILYPDLKISVSVFCVPYFPAWSSGDNLSAQLSGLDDILPYVDILSFSLHPFMSALLAESFPDDYLDQLFSLSTKPVAVSESSYPAQFWQTMSDPILDFNGTEAKQKAFLKLLLSESDRFNAEFVIWFTVRDYDTLWSETLGSSEASLIWRDTGLYDENGLERSALTVWREWFSMGKD